MVRAHVEYVGFSSDEVARNYTLRVRLASGAERDFVVAINNEAFLSRRVRYQDAPEICYLRLQRDLAECGEDMPPDRTSVSDDDIDQYRVAHAPKSLSHRPTFS
jgi:hypothetical protein